MSVLLLNASFEPLRVITTRRAMGLVLAGKAEMLGDGDGEVRSATRSYPIPVVVRLKYMVHIPFGAKVPVNRHTVMVRDKGDCQVAGCPKIGNTLDHVLPRSRGGKHTWKNVVLMCARHNRVKANKLLSELGWQLKVAPRAPHGHYLVLVAAKTKPRAEWAPYLDTSLMPVAA